MVLISKCFQIALELARICGYVRQRELILLSKSDLHVLHMCISLCFPLWTQTVKSDSRAQDNILVGPTYEVDLTTHNSLSNPRFLAGAIEQYNANRTGILTNVGGDVAGKMASR